MNGLPGLQGKLHHLGDFGAVHLPGRAARHCEILRGKVNQAAIYRRASGDHTVGGKILVCHAK
jgi:hypothetical protein